MVRGHSPSRLAIIRALLNLLRVPLAPGEASSSFGFIPETKSSSSLGSILRPYRVFGSGKEFLLSYRAKKVAQKWPRQIYWGFLKSRISLDEMAARAGIEPATK